MQENDRPHYRSPFMTFPRFLLLFSVCFFSPGWLHAQFLLSADGNFELSESVQVDRVEGTALAQLERVKSFLADEKWDEAVETLRQLMENSDEKLIPVAEHRFVGLRDYCQRQLASLPPDALKLYRGRVDATAEKWYREGLANRDRRLLENVVEQAFASSWGDDALLALGDLACEEGDYAAARWYWERIINQTTPNDQRPAPQDQSPKTQDQQQSKEPDNAGQGHSDSQNSLKPISAWPGYPDSTLDTASVRARLVLVSILEGDRQRAKDDLAEFARLHKTAKGWLAGHECVYAEELSRMIAESEKWPPPGRKYDWPTFAGSPQRNTLARRKIESGGVAWKLPLPLVVNQSKTIAADNPAAPLSYHPLLVGDLTLVGTANEIFAVKTATGKPAFGQSAAIYRDPMMHGDGETAMPALGVPRYTMTYHAGKIYAWMGSQLTNEPMMQGLNIRPGSLVCVDLQAEGRLVWKIAPEEGWRFDGSPVADERGVYVAMRRNDIRPQSFVACFDPLTGRPRWRKFIASAETPTRGIFAQNTHNLLTLAGETLYFNTNLGAVAALAADDGRVHWVSLYPRARKGNLEKMSPHWSRDLTPCVFHRGVLYVAPADSPRIFAFDAGDGQILWQSGTEIEDAVHLLGATDDFLLASGSRLYWINLRGQRAGRAAHVWPDGNEKLGLGRGILTDRQVVWPTREKIYLFGLATAKPEKTIELGPLGIAGGNLLLADGALLIATGSELIGIQPGKRNRESEENKTDNKTVARVGE
jgi:outer membrane protein assembly factor BamB